MTFNKINLKNNKYCLLFFLNKTKNTSAYSMMFNKFNVKNNNVFIFTIYIPNDQPEQEYVFQCSEYLTLIFIYTFSSW